MVESSKVSEFDDTTAPKRATIIYQFPAKGSRKARYCIDGKWFLYRYCAERGIPHARCGKLIHFRPRPESTASDGATPHPGTLSHHVDRPTPKGP